MSVTSPRDADAAAATVGSGREKSCPGASVTECESMVIFSNGEHSILSPRGSKGQALHRSSTVPLGPNRERYASRAQATTTTNALTACTTPRYYSHGEQEPQLVSLLVPNKTPQVSWWNAGRVRGLRSHSVPAGLANASCFTTHPTQQPNAADGDHCHHQHDDTNETGNVIHADTLLSLVESSVGEESGQVSPLPPALRSSTVSNAMSASGIYPSMHRVCFQTNNCCANASASRGHPGILYSDPGFIYTEDDKTAQLLDAPNFYVRGDSDSALDQHAEDSSDPFPQQHARYSSMSSSSVISSRSSCYQEPSDLGLTPVSSGAPFFSNSPLHRPHGGGGSGVAGSNLGNSEWMRGRNPLPSFLSCHIFNSSPAPPSLTPFTGAPGASGGSGVSTSPSYVSIHAHSLSLAASDVTIIDKGSNLGFSFSTGFPQQHSHIRTPSPCSASHPAQSPHVLSHGTAANATEESFSSEAAIGNGSEYGRALARTPLQHEKRRSGAPLPRFPGISGGLEPHAVDASLQSSLWQGDMQPHRGEDGPFASTVGSFTTGEPLALCDGDKQEGQEEGGRWSGAATTPPGESPASSQAGKALDPASRRRFSVTRASTGSQQYVGSTATNHLWTPTRGSRGRWLFRGREQAGGRGARQRSRGGGSGGGDHSAVVVGDRDMVRNREGGRSKGGVVRRTGRPEFSQYRDAVCFAKDHSYHLSIKELLAAKFDDVEENEESTP